MKVIILGLVFLLSNSLHAKKKKVSERTATLIANAYVQELPLNVAKQVETTVTEELYNPYLTVKGF